MLIPTRYDMKIYKDPARPAGLLWGIPMASLGYALWQATAEAPGFERVRAEYAQIMGEGFLVRASTDQAAQEASMHASLSWESKATVPAETWQLQEQVVKLWDKALNAWFSWAGLHLDWCAGEIMPDMWGAEPDEVIFARMQVVVRALAPWIVPFARLEFFDTTSMCLITLAVSGVERYGAAVGPVGDRSVRVVAQQIDPMEVALPANLVSAGVQP